MRKLAFMAAMAASSLGARLEPIAYVISPGRRHWGRADRSGSIATGNRHGGPHLHAREIARRARQAARRAAK
jgi:hypothetical protein